MRTLKGEKLEQELLRLEAMKEYEKKYGAGAVVCGIDEAGRGPLAGPVVAGACILPADCQILYLNDSKKLSEKRREALFEEIKEKAVAFGVGIVSPAVIDEINILQATYEAMRQAVNKLPVAPDIFLNDAVIIPGIEENRQVKIIKGRCEKRFHRGGQHSGQGDKGSHDGRVRQPLSSVWLCKAQRLWDKGSFRRHPRVRHVPDS